MLKSEVNKCFTTPLTAPAFPKTIYRFNNREYFNIVYRTELAALRKVVPEPLEIIEPLVRFEIIRMPDSTGLGSYTECGQVIPIQFNGEDGDYMHAMYLDNLPAIAAGREISAYPKLFGKPTLYVDNDTLIGTLDYGSLRVATATMGYKHFPIDFTEARQEIKRPTYMVKIMRGTLVNQEFVNLFVHRLQNLPYIGHGVGHQGYNCMRMHLRHYPIYQC